MALLQHEITLSATENLIPPIVHVKQYDTAARQILCTVFAGSVELTLPSGLVVTVGGERPDGEKFAYTSVINPAVVYLSDNRIVINLQAEMTACAGATTVDLTLVDEGELLGIFPFILRAEKVAVSEAEELAQSMGSSYATVAEVLSALQAAIAVAEELLGESDESAFAEELAALQASVSALDSKLDTAIFEATVAEVSEILSTLEQKIAALSDSSGTGNGSSIYVIDLSTTDAASIDPSAYSAGDVILLVQ